MTASEETAPPEAPSDRPRSGRFSGMPLRSTALNLALIATIFLTRNDWRAWTVEQELPPDLGVCDCVTPDGRRMLLFGNNTACLWDIEEGRTLARYPGKRPQSWGKVSPDGRFFAFVRRGGGPGDPRLVLDAETGKVLAPAAEHAPLFSFARFSPDGRTKVAVEGDGIGCVLDVGTGRLVTTLRGCGPTTSFALLGRRLVSSMYFEKTLRIWDTESYKLVAEVPATWFTVSPDGTLIATVLRGDRHVTVRSAKTGEPVSVWKGGWTGQIAFSPNNRQVLACAHDEMRVWDLVTKEVLSLASDRKLPGYSKRLRGRFFPDGSRVVTYRRGEPARVWDARTGELLARIPGATACRPLPPGQGLPGGTMLVRRYESGTPDSSAVMRRTRPEQWWSVLQLWHFWVIAGLAVALAGSVWWDVRGLRRSQR